MLELGLGMRLTTAIFQDAMNTNIKFTVPRDGEPCKQHRSDQEEEEEDDDELDQSDSGFLSRIEGVRDRLRVYALTLSAESEVPCSNGTYCSKEGECRPVHG